MSKKVTTYDLTQPHTLIINGDGSAIQQGPIGSGLHGYIFLSSKLNVKDGNKPSKYLITDLGYIESELTAKTEGIHKTVIPEAYVDGYCSFNMLSTSNVAELFAFIASAREVVKMFNDEEAYTITNFIYQTDSMYVIHVINNILKDDRWKSEDKINKEYWVMISDVITDMNKLEITFKTEKVKGHGTHLGNNTADRLAFLGRMESTRFKPEINFTITPAKGYWTSTKERHPFLSLRQLFFTNLQRENSDENIFAVMKYKKDDELGKKSHEACFGLVIIKERDEYLETMINEYQKHNKSLSLLSSLDLNNLYSNTVCKYYDIFNTKPFVYNRNNGVLSLWEEHDVVSEIRPAGLATQAFNKVTNLYSLIRAYRAGDNEIIKTYDISKLFYDLDEKDKIKTVIPNGVNTIHVEFNFKGIDIKIPLELGKDTLDRNALKKLESIETKVTLMVEEVSESMAKYYIVIDVQDKGDISIWHNFYSNNILIKALKK